MSLLDYQDPLQSWNDPNAYDLTKVFNPDPLGSTPSPNDGLSNSLKNATTSIGEKTIDFFSKTADLFATGLGYYVQGKNAYDIITNPNEPRPNSPQEFSQLPSLQGNGGTAGVYENFLKLRAVLGQIITPKKSDQVSNVGPYTLSPLLVAAGIVFVLVLITRSKHAR